MHTSIGNISFAARRMRTLWGASLMCFFDIRLGSVGRIITEEVGPERESNLRTQARDSLRPLGYRVG